MSHDDISNTVSYEIFLKVDLLKHNKFSRNKIFIV